jgi:hypothetical protein
MVHFKSTPLFQIRLDEDTLIMRGSKTESVGCVLRGQLVLVITEQTKFKEIRLTFQGKSKISWVDGIYHFLFLKKKFFFFFLKFHIIGYKICY